MKLQTSLLLPGVNIAVVTSSFGSVVNFAKGTMEFLNFGIFYDKNQLEVTGVGSHP